MKNKKKLGSQKIQKEDKRNVKNQPVTILKKSPIKYKMNVNKGQSSLQSNYNMNVNNKSGSIFYGKKYHFGEMNIKKVGDSNQSSTHCSINNRSVKQRSFENKKSNKSKSLKYMRNQSNINMGVNSVNNMRNEQYCHKQECLQDDQIDIRLNQKQIMVLINNYAIKIQRQWRMYWFRKCLRFIILKQRQKRHYQIFNDYYSASNNVNNNNKQLDEHNKQLDENNNKLEENNKQLDKNNNKRVNYKDNRVNNRVNKDNRISHDFESQIATRYKQQKVQLKRHTLPKLSGNLRHNKQKQQLQQNNDSSQQQVKYNNNNLKIKQQIQVSSVQNQLTDQYYNNKKYGTLSSFNSGKLISNNNLSYKNNQHQRTSSLGQKIQQQLFIHKNQLQSNNNNNQQFINNKNQQFINNKIYQNYQNNNNKKNIHNNKKDKTLQQQKIAQIGLNSSLNNSLQSQTYFNTPIQELNNITQNTHKKSSSNNKFNIKLQQKVYECKIKQQNIKQSYNISTDKNKQINVRQQNRKQQCNRNKQLEQSLLMKKNLLQQFQKQQKQINTKKQFINNNKQLINSNRSLTQNINNNKYDTKFPYQRQNNDKDPFGMNKIFKQYKHAIQKQGNKKIYKLQQNLQQKQITQRTYHNLLKQTKDKLYNQIKTLQLKQGHFHNSFKQIYTLFKDYVKQNSFVQPNPTQKIKQNQKQINKINKNQIHYNDQQLNDQNSISFDRWDFESSAKKSISHLQSFEDFARQLNERNPDRLLKGFKIQSKIQNSQSKTIQKVLDQLDELQDQVNYQQNSNKNKLQFNDNQQEDGSILQQFRQIQRTISFQKKNQKVLVQNIKDKLSYAQIKSSINQPTISPQSNQKQLKKLKKIISQQDINLLENKLYQKNIIKQTLQQTKQQEFISSNKQIQPLSKKLNDLQNIKQLSLQIHKQLFIQPKRQIFEFPQIQTPTKSFQNINKKQFIQQSSPPLLRNSSQHLNTDESQQDSQVQIKITSIKIGNKQNKQNKQKQNQLYVPQNNPLQKLSNSILKQLQTQKQLQKQKQSQKQKQQNNKIKQKTISIALLYNFANQYYIKRIIPRISLTINQLSKLIKQSHQQKIKRKQLQQAELKKYPSTIDPTTDAINSWLLQISHHLLDHHNLDIKKNLINVKQVPKQQMLEVSHSQPQSNIFYQTHSYITISQKIFKEFQYFYLKSVANNLQIKQKHQQTFQHLLYAFHRCLIDCMNLTLLDQLSVGRNWIMIPWVNSFRYKKNQSYQHTKQCLQRAINRVSGWGQYCLAQLYQNADVNQVDWKQYQEEKLNLVIREQVLEYPLDNQFVLSNLVLKICKQIYQDQMKLASQQILKILS